MDGSENSLNTIIFRLSLICHVSIDKLHLPCHCGTIVANVGYKSTAVAVTRNIHAIMIESASK